MIKFVDFFKYFKKETEEPKAKVSKNNNTAKALANLRHQKIIDNLNIELEALFKKLKATETNLDMAKSEREKVSDNTIRRITLIEYEIGIREELIKWLS